MPELSEQDDREALVKAALRVLHPNATRNMPMALDYAHKIADALTDAGFRRSPAPQQVSTPEQLDALPDDTVFRDSMGDVGVVHGIAVWYPESMPIRREKVAKNYLPATVLYRPEGGESA